MDKLIAHLVLADLVSTVRAVLMRFIRVHGALEATTHVVALSAAIKWITGRHRTRRPV
ncbi:hypothetical protein [Xanthomonas cannabis]|uniref:hypothetical protein n=1 Tax=Xanthomonas cannabis TaxID=1885674 RepID=UPI000AFED8A8|nr:hypothetical protein [Xanthomonas cannabis]